MKGKLIILSANGGIATQEITKGPALKVLQEVVGGYIELVPGFNTFQGEHCIAYCNEEGRIKGLPTNMPATIAWQNAFGERPSIASARDFELRGSIAIITGDAELMEKL